MKIFELLTRRADQTREVALTYWTDRHAALVKARMEGSGIVRRYVNNVGLTEQPGPGVLPFDGVVGAWLRLDPAVFAQQISATGNPVVADEPNFLACRPVPVLVEEHMVKEPTRRGTAKALIFLRRHPELDRAAFEAALRQDYATSAQSQWGSALVGLGVNLARPMGWGSWGPEWPIYDGVVELWTDADESSIADRLAQGDPVLDRIAPSPATLVVREVFQIDLPLDPA